mmetsp:Transcript_14318/g.19754  ORF Transcript_14318/g.19754 Transcript_14318/m.19754 type:complete len:101 (-) Transcript_14318:155-457(-)
MASSSYPWSNPDNMKAYLKENKLACMGGLWAAAIGLSMAYQWRGSGPASLKIIHSRLYAQAATLTALVGSAGIEMYDRSTQPPPEVELSSYAYTHGHRED